MPWIEENLMNFLRQYLPSSPPQTPDYDIPQGPTQWSMPSNTPRLERLARAKQESAQADVATRKDEQVIRDWLGQAQKGVHKLHSPVDVEFQGTPFEQQYRAYVLNYNDVVNQMNKVYEQYQAGKMSETDWNKAQDALAPVQSILNAKIKQLDQQRMLKAKQVLKGLHGDYQI